MKKRFLTIIGVILMATALFTVIHFIWSDLYIAEFDADNAETVLWAREILDTGKLIDPDFPWFGQLIPVGGNLFFVPFVKAFGVGVLALRAGYTVIAVLFAALLVLALRACLNSWELSMIGSGLILLLMTATEITRDIIWAHSVYYSVAIFFILMCIGSLGLYLRGKRTLGGILFFLSALLCSINGKYVLLYTALPFAAALFLESMNQDRPSEGFMKGPLLLICAAIVCGVGLNTLICFGIELPYSDQYTQISPASQWIENLRLLPECWLEISLDLPKEGVPALSSVGIKLVLRLGSALVLSVLPFFSFVTLQDTKSRLARIVILYHWILCALVLFMFVFGTISDYGAHRLVPLWFSCLLVDWLTMVWMLKKKAYLQTVGAASVCLMALFAGMTAVSVTRKPADLSGWYGNDSIYNVLERHGLTHGYTTNPWYVNSVTVLSESRIKVLSITITEDGFEIPAFSTKESWYKDTSTKEKTFLICLERQLLQQTPWLADEAVEILRATQYTPFYDLTEGYFIVVYDHDIIAEYLQQEQ